MSEGAGITGGHFLPWSDSVQGLGRGHQDAAYTPHKGSGSFVWCRRELSVFMGAKGVPVTCGSAYKEPVMRERFVLGTAGMSRDALP